MIRSEPIRGLVLPMQLKNLACLFILGRLAFALDFTTVPIPGTNSIQTSLMNTFPTGTYTPNNGVGAPFSISTAPGKCGPASNAPCNYYDGFGFTGSGQSITLNVSVANPTDIYTLMNAYKPVVGQQLATITFMGTGGASQTFALVAGENIRDYHVGVWANTLNNGIPGVNAANAFTCTVPTSCQDDSGAASAGTYLIDEQHFTLGSMFAGQTLTQIILTDTYNGSSPILLGLTIGAPGLPAITSGGVVPIDSPINTISSGAWISIYGNNLADTTATWTGNFPTSLGGTSVTVDGKQAYLWYVSPTQINLQVPEDSNTGTVDVVVTTAEGSSTSTATLATYSPSFSLFSSKYPAAIVVTPGSPGNSGQGYDLIGPSGAFSFPSRPVNPGETLILFGVGFGPTSPAVQPGQLFSGAASCVTMPLFSIGGIPATVEFAGIVEAGLFQFNIVVPNAPAGDQVLAASIAGVATPTGVYITLQ